MLDFPLGVPPVGSPAQVGADEGLAFLATVIPRTLSSGR